MSMAGYTTATEVSFIQGMRSPAALRGYLSAIPRRTDWGDINPVIVREAAERRLDEIEKARRGR